MTKMSNVRYGGCKMADQKTDNIVTEMKTTHIFTN